MKKVAAMVWSMSIPMSSEASRSWAVARMALPSRDRSTNSASATTRTSAVTMTMISFVPISAPKRLKPALGRTFG